MELSVTITEDEYKAIADHVISVEEWLQTAISEKAANCISRIIPRETERLINDPNVDNIPATKDALLFSHFSQPDYRDRAERDAEDSDLKQQTAIA